MPWSSADHCLGHRLGGHGGGGLRLEIDQGRQEAQVVGNRMAFGLLAQARRPLGEQRGRLRQAHPRELDAVQRFDLAGLKNALHAQLQSENRPPVLGSNRRPVRDEAGQLLSPVIWRYQPRWCCLAQARVTVP
jgi:hypothetical protein